MTGATVTPKPWLWVRLVKWGVVITFVLCAFGAGTIVAIFYHYGSDPKMPNLDAILNYRAKQITKVYDHNGILLGEIGSEKRSEVHGDAIPQVMIDAVVAAEDGSYFKHSGFSIFGMGRAFVKNVMRGKTAQGGSTITQQVIKTFVLTPERTMRRKVQEIILAYQLEQRYSKREILELYLNRIYFGHNRYGVNEASRYYFGKPPTALTIPEAAMLAGLPQSPVRLSPRTHPHAAKVRRQYVLDRMAVNGMIAIEAAHGIGKDPIALSVDTHPSVGSAPEAMDYVRQELVKRYGAEKLDELGGMVTTSIDADYQSKARRILEHGLEAVSRRHSPHGVPQSAIEAGLQGCIVAIDPRTHEVRAMVGGYDFRAGGFNRALVSRRQAGSLFKAFVYAAGLKTGAFTPNTTFEDEEVFLDSKRPETPWPNNYEPEFQGTVTVTDAFARSINTVAVQALQETGITSVIGTARSLGITTAIPRDLSLALGTGTVVPLEIANAYASIAAGGTFAKPVFITEVNGSAEAAGAPVQVLSTETADEMVGLMRAVVEQGTGGAARGKLPFALAGKTGTTSDHSDAWFAGFSRELVTVVWVGYDKTRSIGDHETGARAALPIWLEFMGQALIGKSVVNLDAPVRILPPREEEEATDTGSEGGSLGIGSGVDDEFEAPDVTDDDGPELPTLDDTEVELPQTDEE